MSEPTEAASAETPPASAPDESLTDAQRATRERIAKSERDGVGGPGDAWAHSPDLARATGRLGAFFRSDRSALSQRLTELAILVTARAWTAQIEWYAHAPRARREGIGREIIAAIAQRQEPEFSAQDEAIVYRFAHELNELRSVSDATFARAVEVLGSRAVVDLTALIGFYGMVATTLKTYRLVPPADATRLLPE